MLRSNLVLPLAIAAGLAAATAFAQPPTEISGYRHATMLTFDANGVLQKKVRREDLPTPPQKIVGSGAEGLLAVGQGKQRVYLRSADVLFGGEVPKEVVCDAVANGTRAAGSSYAGTNNGMGSSCKAVAK